MKAANPQAIITWTSGTSLGTVLRAISNAGWDVPVATSDSNMLYRQMAQYTGFMPKQFYIPAPQWLPSANTAAMPADVQAAQKQMNDAFKAAGTRPDIAAVAGLGPGADRHQRVEQAAGRCRCHRAAGLSSQTSRASPASTASTT